MATTTTDFPIPADLEGFWQWDQLHCPRPLTVLEHELLSGIHGLGVQQGDRRAGVGPQGRDEVDQRLQLPQRPAVGPGRRGSAGAGGAVSAATSTRCCRCSASAGRRSGCRTSSRPSAGAFARTMAP